MHSDCVLRTIPFWIYCSVYSKNTDLYPGRCFPSCDEFHSWLSCVGTTAAVLQVNPGGWALISFMWISVNICMNINGWVVALKISAFVFDENESQL